MSTHDDYITEDKFNSSFKNMLRDYYTYGFKDRCDFPSSIETYTKDKKRLKDLLESNMEWGDKKKRKSDVSEGENVTFILCDSQTMNFNPFHKVYRFCGRDNKEYVYSFFHTIIALNSLFQLSNGTDDLGLEGNGVSRFEKKINIQEKNQISRTLKSIGVEPGAERWLQQFYDNAEILIKEIRKERYLSDEQISKIRSAVWNATIMLKTSDLIMFYPEEWSRDKTKDTIMKSTNNRLKRLSNIGVIQCCQNGGDGVFSDEMVEQMMDAIPDDIKLLLDENKMSNKLKLAFKKYKKPNSGDHKWYLSKLTIKRILECGQTVNEHFGEHFRYVLDFYSKTFLYGEIGTFLLDRMGTGSDSPIRIKHEYYMHSLNDFNVIDLMDAIENNEWCLITYKTNEVETNIFCYPIEIRISSINGREYLMFYEPLKKSCSALRLEFIDEVLYYHDFEVKKCLAKHFPDVEVDVEVNRNLSRSKLLMDYVWGVSTGAVQEKNVENLNTIFDELCVRIKYNEETDYYILKRLYRESRIGKISVRAEEGYIDFSVVTADIKEVIPFIRSFYSRVVFCTGFDAQGFSVKMDIENINKEMDKTQKDVIQNVWGIDDDYNDFLRNLGEGIKPTAHNKLFNEIFSVFYQIFAAVICEISCKTRQSYTKDEIKEICFTTMNKYKDKCGSEMLWNSFKNGEVFVDKLKEGGFLLEEELEGESLRYKSKYETSSLVNLYKDVIPLSEIEIRWLKTILKDEKIHYFLNDKEIMVLKLLLAEMAIDIKPFPMKVVNYYDRYKISPKKEWKESTIVVPILDAVRKGHTVEIKYRSKKNNYIHEIYKPILVEYSKRDNRFRGYFMGDSNKIEEYPLAQCISVVDVGETFDKYELTLLYERYRQKQMGKVELEFKDRPKLADHILTEFSPWKKSCKYDSESGMYNLTIYYQKQDGKEIALRLLRLGSKIRLLDSNHKLSKILYSKLRIQSELIQREDFKKAKERMYDSR